MESIYNTDSAPQYLPTYDVTVATGESTKVSRKDADNLVATGLWSRTKPGGKK